MNNMIAEEVLNAIDNIDGIVIESELNVLHSMLYATDKMSLIMEYYEGDDIDSFNIFQESYIQEGETLDAIKKDVAEQGKKYDSKLMKILTLIPRILISLVRAITGKLKKSEEIINNTDKALSDQSDEVINASNNIFENLLNTAKDHKGLTAAVLTFSAALGVGIGVKKSGVTLDEIKNLFSKHGMPDLKSKQMEKLYKLSDSMQTTNGKKLKDYIDSFIKLNDELTNKLKKSENVSEEDKKKFTTYVVMIANKLRFLNDEINEDATQFDDVGVKIDDKLKKYLKDVYEFFNSYKEAAESMSENTTDQDLQTRLEEDKKTLNRHIEYLKELTGDKTHAKFELNYDKGKKCMMTNIDFSSMCEYTIDMLNEFKTTITNVGKSFSNGSREEYENAIALLQNMKTYNTEIRVSKKTIPLYKSIKVIKDSSDEIYKKANEIDPVIKNLKIGKVGYKDFNTAIRKAVNNVKKQVQIFECYVILLNSMIDLVNFIADNTLKSKIKKKQISKTYEKIQTNPNPMFKRNED